jgi:hypothetical protein
MKKSLILILFSILFSLFFSFAFQTLQAETYYSQGSIRADELNSWNTIRTGGGSAPTGYNLGDNFVVQSGDSMVVYSFWNMDANLHLESNSILYTNQLVLLDFTSTFQMDAGSKCVVDVDTVSVFYILVGTESFAPTSTFEFRNWYSNPIVPAITGNWGNLIISGDSTEISPLEFNMKSNDTIAGNLIIKNSVGGTTVMNLPRFGTTNSLTIKGDLIISDGGLHLKANFSVITANINVWGSFVVTGNDSVRYSNLANFVYVILSGANKSLASNSLTFADNPMNWVILSGASYTLAGNLLVGTDKRVSVNGTLDAGANVISGAGGFTVGSTGTFKSGHENGVNGNLTLTGTKVFNGQYKLEWNGTTAQSMGIAGLAITNPNRITISNTSSIVTADADITLGNNASFIVNTNAIYNADTFTVNPRSSDTIKIAGTFRTPNANGFFGGAGTSIKDTNSPVFNFTGGTVEYSGSLQRVSEGVIYNNLTIGGTATKQIYEEVKLTGILEVNTGLWIDTCKLTGIGASFAASTQIIDVASLSQVSGFINSFPGTFWLYGNNAEIPAGTYNNVLLDSATYLTGDVIINQLRLFAPLYVGSNSLTLGRNLAIGPSYLITDSTSKLAFTGTTNITIPSQVTSLSGLTLNTSAPNGVTAPGNLVVKGIVTMTNGVLRMGSNILTADSVAGGSTTSYVQMDSIGRLKINDVNGTAIFPIGNTSYNPCTIYNAGVTPDNFTVGIKNTITNPTPDNNQAVQREWNITEDVPGDVDAYLTFGWSTADEGSGVNRSVLSIADFTGITYEPIRCDPVSGSNPWTITTSVPVTSFSPFVIANDGVAPVELASFTSVINKNNVRLNWGTVMEENNSGFDIERKNENGLWSKIGNVQGNGTSNNVHSYSFEDRNLSTGNYNYRLKQVDFNGNHEYFNLSDEVIVGLPVKFELSQNYPNPFNPSTNINFELPANNFVSLKIYDMTGREVMQLVNELKQAGYYTVKFDAKNLSSGMYFYIIQAGDFVSTKKMMLVK